MLELPGPALASPMRIVENMYSELGPMLDTDPMKIVMISMM
jgi:hypothetical protein